MAEPHRSRTPAPRQPSPAGSGSAWFTPVQQPPRLPSAAARLQHGLTPAAIVACSPSTTTTASLQYAPVPRTCLQMWPKLVAGAKDGGADCIEKYVFWNGQETAPGKCYFKERFDLVQFARVVKDVGVYLMLRIGLFIPAEWNFGGVPAWLHCIPTTVFRTDNEPFKERLAFDNTVLCGR